MSTIDAPISLKFFDFEGEWYVRAWIDHPLNSIRPHGPWPSLEAAKAQIGELINLDEARVEVRYQGDPS